MTDYDYHYRPKGIRNRIAFGFVKFLRFFADLFFRKRYGHRAVVLETVAAVPGMVGGLLQHLKALRRIRDDQGWIKELLDEAENERMHLMTVVRGCCCVVVVLSVVVIALRSSWRQTVTSLFLEVTRAIKSDALALIEDTRRRCTTCLLACCWCWWWSTAGCFLQLKVSTCDS